MPGKVGRPPKRYGSEDADDEMSEPPKRLTKGPTSKLVPAKRQKPKKAQRPAKRTACQLVKDVAEVAQTLANFDVFHWDRKAKIPRQYQPGDESKFSMPTQPAAKRGRPKIAKPDGASQAQALTNQLKCVYRPLQDTATPKTIKQELDDIINYAEGVQIKSEPIDTYEPQNLPLLSALLMLDRPIKTEIVEEIASSSQPANKQGGEPQPDPVRDH